MWELPDDTKEATVYARFRDALGNMLYSQDAVIIFKEQRLRTSQVLREYDHFGHKVCVSGDGTKMVVSCPQVLHREGTLVGRVYTYTWDGEQWGNEQVLMAQQEIEQGDCFGKELAMSSDGSTLAVYAPTNYHLNLGKNIGRVYTYKWNGNSWVNEKLLKQINDDNGGVNDDFGYSLSLSGDGFVLAVGAPTDSAIGKWQGSAYIYRWNGSNWTDEVKIFNTDNAFNGDYFGWDLCLSGDGNTLAISAPCNDTANLVQENVSYVTIYKWNGSTWNESDRIIPTFNVDQSLPLGRSIDLSYSGNVLVVGHELSGYNGTSSEGSVFIYRYNGLSWDDGYFLTPSLDEGNDDRFGTVVSISADGSILAVLASYTEVAGADRGAVFMFKWIDEQWCEETLVVPVTDVSNTSFRGAINLSSDGKTLIVGARNSVVSGVSYAGSVFAY